VRPSLRSRPLAGLADWCAVDVSAELEPGISSLGQTRTAAELAESAGTGQRLSLMHIGLDGRLKVLDFFPTSSAVFRDILEGGERVDASGIFPGCCPGGRSDVLLRPRVWTAFEDPFSSPPAIAVLCSHLGSDGLAYPVSPDSIVRAAEQRVREQLGVELWAHAEVEFFFGRIQGPSAATREGPSDSCVADDGYQATRPIVFGETARRRAHELLSKMCVRVKYAHAEAGHITALESGGIAWEQHEIELALTPLSQAADAVALTQWVVRQVAEDAGLLCSFDPVVCAGHAGNGLHIHFAALRDGRFVEVLGPPEAPAEEASWLIAGLVQRAGAFMAYGNRVPGSFARLTQGREAPQDVSWGVSDRHALIRIPIRPRTETGRLTGAPTVELRLPDGSAHPHLLLATAAYAFVEGARTQDRESLLDRSRVGGPGPDPLPHDPREVAAALEHWRPHLTEDHLFPQRLLDATVAELRQRDA
jgi:glutamine synthetase